MYLSDFLSWYDFGYRINENGKFQFVDWQEANLGGICDAEYDSPTEMVERLQGSIYEDDYIISAFEDITNIDSTSLTYLEMAEQLEINNEKTMLIDLLKTLDNPQSIKIEKEQMSMTMTNDFFRREVIKPYIEHHLKKYKQQIMEAAKRKEIGIRIEPCKTHYDEIVNILTEEGFVIKNCAVSWFGEVENGSDFYKEVYEESRRFEQAKINIMLMIKEVAQEGLTSLSITPVNEATEYAISQFEEMGFTVYRAKAVPYAEIRWEEDFSLPDYYGASQKFYAKICRVSSLVTRIRNLAKRCGEVGRNSTAYIFSEQEPEEVISLVKEPYENCRYCTTTYDKISKKFTINW